MPTYICEKQDCKSRTTILTQEKLKENPPCPGCGSVMILVSMKEGEDAKDLFTLEIDYKDNAQDELGPVIFLGKPSGGMKAAISTEEHAFAETIEALIQMTHNLS